MAHQHVLEQKRVAEPHAHSWHVGVHSRPSEAHVNTNWQIQLFGKLPERLHANVIRTHAMILGADLGYGGELTRGVQLADFRKHFQSRQARVDTEPHAFGIAGHRAPARLAVTSRRSIIVDDSADDAIAAVFLQGGSAKGLFTNGR